MPPPPEPPRLLDLFPVAPTSSDDGPNDSVSLFEEAGLRFTTELRQAAEAAVGDKDYPDPKAQFYMRTRQATRRVSMTCLATAAWPVNCLNDHIVLTASLFGDGASTGGGGVPVASASAPPPPPLTAHDLLSFAGAPLDPVGLGRFVAETCAPLPLPAATPSRATGGNGEATAVVDVLAALRHHPSARSVVGHRVLTQMREDLVGGAAGRGAPG